MNRREFLTIAGAGIGLVGCGPQPSPDAATDAGVSPAAPATAGAQRIVVRAVGLNAFLESKDGVQIAMLNPVGLPLHAAMGQTFPEHSTTLAVANDHLADPTLGTEPTADDLKRWNLRSKTTAFRKFDLKGTVLTFDRVTGPDFEVSIYGAMPVRRLAPDGVLKDWTQEKVVGARVDLKKHGAFRDDLPRKYPNNTHKRLWRFTTKKWEESGDALPVRLTDTIRIDLDADLTAPAQFVFGSTSVLTKGEEVEAYLITLPTALLQFEKEHPLELHHTVAGYELFDNTVAAMPIPKGDPGVQFTEEPVFCPPLYFSEI